MCEYEVEQNQWRADVLAFIRDHIEPMTTYRLRSDDLAFAELLLEKPWCVEQAEFEERDRLRFDLERLTNRIDDVPWGSAPWTASEMAPTRTPRRARKPRRRKH